MTGFRFLEFWLVAFLSAAASGCVSSGDRNEVCFDRKCVQVEVVRHKEQLTRGLQFREQLGENQGMLFVFSHSQIYSFWMKDTFIPLDIIWLDHAQKVVEIRKNALPCTSDPCPVFTPTRESLYVLEVNAKLCDRLGIKVGQVARFFIKEVAQSPKIPKKN